MKKFLPALWAVTLFTVSLLGTTAIAQSPALQVTPPAVNFGDIVQADGPVTSTVQLTNTSTEPIQINRLSTSCGCTTAEMDLSDFQPNENRPMTITFDPNTHPDQFGEITRVVYLQTSDPIQPELEIDVTGFVLEPEQSKVAHIFFNEACQDCGELVKNFYPDFFKEYGYEIILHDYVNERENRKLLNEYNKKWGVPFELQSHIEAFVGDNLLLGGHIPEASMRYALENPDQYQKLLVYQDKMHGEETDYKVWDFKGDIKTYPIKEPLKTYFSDNNGGNSSTSLSQKGFWGLFAVITSSAFLDGINPCAIAVLLFFIAFLFTLKKTRTKIWKMGLVYIFSIFLAYFLIGIGIAQAIIISGSPHLMAYVGAYLVIGLGVIQVLGTLFPSFPIKLRIPVNTKPIIEKYLNKATLPAAFIGGFVVGLCTFPCSGGIYVAIIGMLAASQTYASGLGWMVWYNLIFILPLILILAFAGNPYATEKLQQWERKEAKSSKLIIGAAMIALGLIIILFFT